MSLIGGLEIDNTTEKKLIQGLIDETNIQDLLFMKRIVNKSSDVFELRGVYNVSDNDFDLTQFGLFLPNDTLFISFHINMVERRMGRRHAG